jgi:hypothetical protein
LPMARMAVREIGSDNPNAAAALRSRNARRDVMGTMCESANDDTRVRARRSVGSNYGDRWTTAKE